MCTFILKYKPDVTTIRNKLVIVWEKNLFFHSFYIYYFISIFTIDTKMSTF